MDVMVTAKKAFPYRGRDVRPGDVIQMDPIDALMYQRYSLVGITIQQTYLTRELTAR